MVGAKGVYCPSAAELTKNAADTMQVGWMLDYPGITNVRDWLAAGGPTPETMTRGKWARLAGMGDDAESVMTIMKPNED